MLVLRIYTPRRVRHGAVLIYLLDRFEHKAAVLNVYIFRGVHIGLKLIVHPSRIMELHIPVVSVQCLSLKLVFPLKFISFIRQRCIFFLIFHLICNFCSQCNFLSVHGDLFCCLRGLLCCRFCLSRLYRCACGGEKRACQCRHEQK